MAHDTLTLVTGLSGCTAGSALLIGGWARRSISTAAARAMALCLGLWFLRYGVNQLDRADGHVSRLGQTLSDPRTLALSTAVLASSALLYATEDKT